MTVTARARLRAVLFLGAALSVAGVAAAQTGPANVVVYRVGSGGASPLVTTGNAVFLDEYTPSGVLVQSIALPAAGSGLNRALVASGTANSDGLLTRSTDGTCLVIPGYGRDIGTGNGNLTTTGTLANGNAIPRVVGIVRANGSIDTTTALTDAGLGSNFRGAASTDCSNLWVSGTAQTSPTPLTGGVRFANAGATSSSDLTSANFANVRAVAIFGGQLYTSASVTNLRGVATVGTGLPTASLPTPGQVAVTKLLGLTNTNSPSSYAFFFADLTTSVAGLDTLYVADDDTGALTKFALVSGSWISKGTIGVVADAYRGLTGVVNGTSVTLFATRKGGTTASGGGELVRFLDASGYNGTFAGSPAIIATAANNTAFRGVALALPYTVTASAGLHGSITPTGAQVVAGGAQSAFTVTPDPGYTAVVGGNCGGNLVGATYTTTPVTVNCTVSATFLENPFTVTPSVAGLNGSLSPSTIQLVPRNSSATFTVTPSPGYAASIGGTCGGTLSGNQFVTAPVVANCSVTAMFTLITFTVTPIPGANGVISPDFARVIPQGHIATFSVTPAAGFSATVGGTCGGTLAGTTYTTLPVLADCSVEPTFPPLPRYTATPSASANGSVTPSTPQSVIVGATTSFSVEAASGYNAAIRGTCGGTLSGSTYTIAPIAADCTVEVTFARKLVLFVGNSFTFGRVDPVMSYHADHVTDLTDAMWHANTAGSNADEPHPWGGIPGVFKKLTEQAELDIDVSISARNAASLRGHYLNLNPAGWDLRGNIASQPWDVVMLQDLSDEPLPAGRGANANLPFFNLYTDKIETFIHDGAADGSIPANPNARSSADVFLYETWARPDMIAHTGADPNYYTVAEGLTTMTADFHDAYFGRAAANLRIAGVSPVGDAFLRAVQDGVAMSDPYALDAAGIDLWHTDFFHPSKYGSYLSALVHFGVITKMNPMMFGRDELAAFDLGIDPDVAVALQRVARETVFPDVAAPTSTAVVSEPPNSNGWNRSAVTVTLTAEDDPGGWGVRNMTYAMSGAQTDSGPLVSGDAVTISAEGVTTLTYFATDDNGNAEAAHTLVVRIDSTSPVTSATLSPAANAAGWHTHDAAVNFSAGDNFNGSGVDFIRYTLTGAQSGSGTLSAADAVPISAEGTTTVNYFSVDLAGNTETVRTLVVRIDSAPPVTDATLSSPANAAGWHGHDVMVSFAAGDIGSGSGVAFIGYTLTGAQSGTGTIPAAGAVTISAEGTTTVNYFSVDAAGNAETIHTLVVRIDSTRPVSVATLSPPANAAGWHHGTVALDFSASDNGQGSGVEFIRYTLTGAQSGSGALPAAGSLTISAEGMTTVAYFATDLAGNAENVRMLVVRIDATPPVFGALAGFSVDATSPAGATVTYGATATDNSGLAPAIVCTPASGAVLPIGQDHISCVATDAAGNSATSSFIVTVDGVAPQTVRLLIAVLALRGINVSPAFTNVLAAFLQVALLNGNGTVLCAALTSFVKQVTLLSGRGIPVAQATQLVAAANRIRAVQGCHF
jgi:hypothetical protein